MCAASMVPTKQHLREIMLFHFHKKLTASATAVEICAVYGSGAVDDRTVRRWFQRFRSGDTDVKDKPLSG